MSVFDQLEEIIEANLGCATPEECLAKLGTPSTSVAILEDGKLTSRCYSTVGDDTETVFQACSISKAVNAIAVMRLVEQGVFKLSSTIGELLPGNILDIMTSGSPASQRKLVESITVKQLMSHTAGLSIHGFEGYGPNEAVPTVEQILSGQHPANSMRVRLNQLPGREYNYSGGGITVLQVVMEAAANKNHPELMQDLVLNPLSMTRSFYGKLPDSEKNAAKSYHTGYTITQPNMNELPELAAAGLWTTPTDLLKVVSSVQASILSDNGLLKQATAKKMITEVDDGMALSWFNEGTKLFGHSGANAPGYRTMLLGSTDEKNGVSVMTNSAMGNDTYWAIIQAIYHLKGWPLELKGAAIKATPFALPASAITDDWKPWSGQWTDEKKQHCYVIDSSGDVPTITYDGFGPISLFKAASPVPVYVLEGLDYYLRLQEKDGNKVIEMTNESSRKSFELKRDTTEKGDSMSIKIQYD